MVSEPIQRGKVWNFSKSHGQLLECVIRGWEAQKRRKNEEILKKYEGNMKKYVGNMKEFVEGFRTFKNSKLHPLGSHWDSDERSTE